MGPRSAKKKLHPKRRPSCATVQRATRTEMPPPPKKEVAQSSSKVGPGGNPPPPKKFKKQVLLYSREPQKNLKADRSHEETKEFPEQFEGNIPNKTKVLRQIAPESSPESSVPSLSQKFFGVPFSVPDARGRGKRDFQTGPTFKILLTNFDTSPEAYVELLFGYSLSLSLCFFWWISALVAHRAVAKAGASSGRFLILRESPSTITIMNCTSRWTSG